VLAELKAAVSDLGRRIHRSGGRTLEERRSRLAAARLPRREALLGPVTQRFDMTAGRLKAALEKNAALHDRDLHGVSARFGPALLDRPRALKAQRVDELAKRLEQAALRAGERSRTGARLPQLNGRMKAALDRKLASSGERPAQLEARMQTAFERRLQGASERLEQLEKLRLSLCPNRPLELGFARVHRADGSLARSGAELKTGEAVRLVFNADERAAVVDGAPGTAPSPSPAAAHSPVPTRQAAKPRPPAAPSVQAELF
jgi:exodeoxyribonuclease VII large subunit